MSNIEESINRLSKHNSINEINYFVYISSKFKYMYFSVPKSACSTIKYFLMRNENRHFTLGNAEAADYEQFDRVHDRSITPLYTPRQFGPISSVLDDPEFRSFTFVRNPYDRLASAYLDKIVRNRPQAVELRRYLNLADQDPEAISFDTFITTICGQPIKSMNPHWRIQYYMACCDCVNHDYIGKVEQLSQDIERLSDLLGLNSNLLIRNAPHGTSASEHVSGLFTPRLRTMVADKFAADFTTFGYPV